MFLEGKGADTCCVGSYGRRLDNSAANTCPAPNTAGRMCKWDIYTAYTFHKLVTEKAIEIHVRSNICTSSQSEVSSI